jgi:hypothetical protein
MCWEGCRIEWICAVVLGSLWAGFFSLFLLEVWLEFSNFWFPLSTIFHFTRGLLTFLPLLAVRGDKGKWCLSSVCHFGLISKWKTFTLAKLGLDEPKPSRCSGSKLFIKIYYVKKTISSSRSGLNGSLSLSCMWKEFAKQINGEFQGECLDSLIFLSP